MSPSTISCQAKLNDASEVYRLSLLLTVCAAVNEHDLHPRFTARLDSEERWLWCEAKKLDSDSTVIDAATNILVLDRQILAGMAAGKCALFVLSDSSSDPVINHHEGADALHVGHCVVRPDGVDYWAKTKISGNECSVFHLEKWVFERTAVPHGFSLTICQQTNNIKRSRNNSHRISERLSEDGRCVRAGQNVFPVF